MSQQVNLKNSGIQTHANNLSGVSAGSMSESVNTVIDRNEVLEQRRGFSQYGNNFGITGVNSVKQFINYKDLVIRHVEDKLQFDSDLNGNFRDLINEQGFEVLETELGLRLKSIESNGNLYFTTADGIKKVSARNRLDLLSQSITSAGGIKALDINVTLDFSELGFLEPNSKVAYRVVFGYKDLNENLILGSPSAPAQVYNSTTTSCFTDLSFSLPPNLTNQYFYQIYRTALSTDVAPVEPGDPGDEMNLVFEENITDNNLLAGTISITDKTPEDFRRTGTLLYTNPVSGEGIAQANEPPPFAKDITAYKGYTFYGNTASVQRLNFSLLTVENINLATAPELLVSSVGTALTLAAPYTLKINDTVTFGLQTKTIVAVINSTSYTLNTAFSSDLTNQLVTVSRVDTFSVSDNNAITTTYTFQGHVETYTADYTGSVPLDYYNAVTGNAKYFTFIAANDERRYYNYYFSSDKDLDPGISVSALSGYVGIKTTINPEYTLEASSTGTSLTLTTAPEITINIGDTVTRGIQTRTITAVLTPTTYTINTAFTPDLTTEDVVVKTFDTLASIRDKTAFAILEATDDFNVEVSTVADQVLITTANNGSVDLVNFPLQENINNFLITSDNAGLGEDASANKIFLPRVPVGAENGPTVSQQLEQLAKSLIRVVNAQDPLAVGYYQSTYLSVPGQMLLEGKEIVGPVFYLYSTVGLNFTPTLSETNSTTNLVQSSNEVRPNRIMFSKFQQPEAVPLANFIDVGPKDRAIKRIIALRDSLFIMKEDGIYRLSGDVAPFSVSPFDFSVQVLAADTAVVLNNQIYALSTQGVITITDTGVSVISRPIENRILQVTRDSFNYKTLSFGVSYESDRAFHLWLPTLQTDTFATQCYRYNTFTNTWTRWDKNATAGIVNFGDNRMYLGPGDLNVVEKERKSLTRTDYADREFDKAVILNGVTTETIKRKVVNKIEIDDTANISAGDVILQNQTVTVDQFNRLLNKLDDDLFITNKTYLQDLEMFPGKNIRNAIENLAVKLDADPDVDQTFYSSLVGVYTNSITSIVPLGNNTVVNITGINGIKVGRFVKFNFTDTLPSLNAGNYEVVAITPTSITINKRLDLVFTNPMPATIETDETSFEDVQGCYNIITVQLNSDNGLNFTNYPTSTGNVEIEHIIQTVDKVQRTVTVETYKKLLSGPLKLYKAIKTKTIYNPQFFGDVSMDKQVREGTAIFENDNFSTFIIGYASDKLPSFIDTEFKRPGIGDWGQFGWDQNNWGGVAAPIPLRTYVPLDKQRCRFLNVKLEHKTAREKYSLFGFSLTFRMYNTRSNK